MPVLRSLRQQGVNVQMHAGGADGMGSMKSQFKKADASGARFALIFGEQEMQQGSVALKALRGPRNDAPADAAQSLLPLDGVASWAQRLRSA